MANRQIALGETLKKEGFYSNDQTDHGKETIWGISRVMNPGWDGWKDVDDAKAKPGFPDSIKLYAPLLVKRDKFYDQMYWQPICGDQIINQEVANDIFDSSVNMGVHQAVVLCQRTLGMTESGKMDAATLNKLNEQNPF